MTDRERIEALATACCAGCSQAIFMIGYNHFPATGQSFQCHAATIHANKERLQVLISRWLTEAERRAELRGWQAAQAEVFQAWKSDANLSAGGVNNLLGKRIAALEAELKERGGLK